MNNFSSVMKSLRKQRNLTQEQLAEALGISCQAVSKWETGLSYPDITLLPIIADYFGVSIDYLLGHDTGRQNEEIEQACSEAEKLFESGGYAQAIPILRKALVRHPGNEKLMYTLAWALSGTIRESPDNYEEAILLYLKILAISTDVEMKTRVTRDLVYRYYTKRELDKALIYAQSLPPFEVCREYTLGRSNVLQGRELAEYLRSNIRLFGDAMLECLEYFSWEKILSPEEKLPYTTESAREKIELLKQVLS